MGLLDAALSKVGLAPASRVEQLTTQVTAIQRAAQRRIARSESVAASASQAVVDLRAEVDGLSRRMFNERRASGVEISSGAFEYEVNTNLRGDKRWQTYAKMVTDPHVKGALRFNVLPLLAAEWDVAPGGDDPRDVEIAEFVKANLLRMPCDKYGREYALKTPWRQRLFEILDMLESGFAMFSKTTRVQGAKLIYDDLKWLEPSSVDPRGWKLDAFDRIVTVERTFTDPTLRYHTQEPMPAEALSLYVWELKGARFEGVPFIRPMYGPWFRKDFLVRMGTIWAQKVGAPVPMGSYPLDWPDEIREKFIDFIKSLRGTSAAESFGVFPQTPDGKEATAKYAGVDTGDVDRMRSMIDGENAEIAHAGGTKGLLLGETQTGSRALGQTMSATEFLFLQAIAECVCDVANHGTGPMEPEVEQLVDWNYAGVRNYPRLVCSKVHPDQALRHFDQVQKAFSSGLLPKVPEARKIVADMLGFKLPDEVFEDDAAYEVRDPLAERRDSPAGNRPGAGRGSEYDETETELALDTTALRERFSALLAPEEGAALPAAGFRRPTRLESRYCDLAAVSESFRVGERDIHNQLRDMRDAMIRDLMQRLRAGKITPRNMESQRRSQFRGFKKWSAKLTETVTRVGRDGMAHVEQEIAAQRTGGRRASVA